MRYIIIPLILFTLCSISYAGIEIQVIYPILDQQLPNVDSTFIFGNVDPGAKLSINGYPVEVYEDGGWLAYLPVIPGEFEFHILATNNGDTSAIVLPVQVGPAKLIDLGSRPRIPAFPYPDSDMVYTIGDRFRFSFQAPGGGTGWFRIGDSDSVRMYEEKDEGPQAAGSVFGDLPSNADPLTDYVEYSGYCRLDGGDVGHNSISYWYYPAGVTMPGDPGVRRYSTDVILTVMPEYPPVIGELSGTSQIIRTGPRKGYKLLYLPPGIKVLITGAEKGFYRLRLGEGITGYVDIDSVTVLPAGYNIPSGRVSFITANETPEYMPLPISLGRK